MICLICRQSDLVDDLTSIPFGRGEFRLLIRDVPAWVCPNCGEAVVDEGVAVQLICLAEDLFDEGIREDVCEYRHFAKVTLESDDSPALRVPSKYSEASFLSPDVETKFLESRWK